MNLLLPSRLRHLLIALIFGGFFGHAPIVSAKPEQDSAEALKAANARLVKLLDETDNLFYKTKTNEEGGVFYSVVWESDGETSKIILGLKELGHFGDEYIYGLTAWTYVATSPDPMPPAVIKAVATANDSLSLGSFSCSKDFKQVYANMNGILENASSGSIWMYFAYLHSNRIHLKEQVDQAMTGAGR